MGEEVSFHGQHVRPSLRNPFSKLSGTAIPDSPPTNLSHIPSIGRCSPMWMFRNASKSTGDSAGQLSHDSFKAFPKSFLDSGCIWLWPLNKRPKNPKGMPGKLHAKCLVIDDTEVLVSSANLACDLLNGVADGIEATNPVGSGEDFTWR